MHDSRVESVQLLNEFSTEARAVHPPVHYNDPYASLQLGCVSSTSSRRIAGRAVLGCALP